MAAGVRVSQFIAVEYALVRDGSRAPGINNPEQMVREQNNLYRLGWVVEGHIPMRMGVLVGTDCPRK